MNTSVKIDVAALVEAACDGDEDAYRSLVEPYRGELHAHCYRMLGSLDDGEDALQEAMLRAWKGMRGFEGRSSFRAWLYRIATNVCLDMAGKRAKRGLPTDHAPWDEAQDGDARADLLWLDPYPDETFGLPAGPSSPETRYEQRESVELAFTAALQHLPGLQRAVLILRDVVGFSIPELAETLDTTVAAVNSALQRARRSAEKRLPARSQQATLRGLGDARLSALVTDYMSAWERGDLTAIVAMLTEDAQFAMPPVPSWYQGRDAIADFLPRGPLTDRWRFIPVRAGGQPAFGTYNWDQDAGCYLASALDVLTLRGDRVCAITAFLYPELMPRFGLPEKLGGER